MLYHLMVKPNSSKAIGDKKLGYSNTLKTNNTNFKAVGQPLRIALTGSKFGPGLYDIIMALGKEEVLKRLSKIIP